MKILRKLLITITLLLTLTSFILASISLWGKEIVQRNTAKFMASMFTCNLSKAEYVNIDDVRKIDENTFLCTVNIKDKYINFITVSFEDKGDTVYALNKWSDGYEKD